MTGFGTQPGEAAREKGRVLGLDLPDRDVGPVVEHRATLTSTTPQRVARNRRMVAPEEVGGAVGVAACVSLPVASRPGVCSHVINGLRTECPSGVLLRILSGVGAGLGRKCWAA